MRTLRRPSNVSTLLVLLFLSLSITLTAVSGSSVAPAVQGTERTVVLTVQVFDEDGNAVRNAHVNVYQEHRRGSSLFVKPPDYQQDTDARGIAQLNIRVKAGEALGITIEVSREDLDTQSRELDLKDFPPRLPLEKFVLGRRVATSDTGYNSGIPLANVRVNVKDDRGNNLEGALVKVSSGGWTPSISNKPHQQTTGPDGSATIPVELMRGGSAPTEGFTLRVSKPGYSDGMGVIEFSNEFGKAKGKTFDYVQPNKDGQFEVSFIILTKAATSASAIEVKITVLDGETNDGVSEAEVVLRGPNFATATTDSSGVAKLSVDKPGGYVVRLSQDNFYPVENIEIRVLATGAAPEPFRLRRKPNKDAAKDTIDITVLRKDSIDDTKPQPLKGAAVSDGRGTEYSDEDGQAKLRGAFDSATQIRVTADGYKPLTKTVPIYKPLMGPNTGRATFILEPELSNSSAIRLIVEVRDRATDQIVPQARAYLWFKGRNIDGDRGAAGEVTFVLRDSAETPLAELRNGLKVFADATNYNLRDSDISPDLLLPSLEARRVTVFLERNWDDIRKAVDNLEARVFAWNNDWRSDYSSGATKKFIDDAVTARRDAQTLANEITAARNSIVPKGTKGSLCAGADPYLLNIRAMEAQANQKAKELKERLDEAETLTKICSTQRDADLIRSNYRTAIRLTAEIGSLNKKIVNEHDQLTAIVWANSKSLDLLLELKQKLYEIGHLESLATEIASSAKSEYQRGSNLSKSLVSRQLTLKAELAVLQVKVESETNLPADLRKRIDTMAQILGSTNNVYSYGAKPEQALPSSVRDAAQEIARFKSKAEADIAAFEGSICNAETLDDVVNGVDATFTNAQLEISLAADLPTKADECASGRIAIPPTLEEREGGFTATWTLLPSGNQFHSKWSNGAEAILKIEKFDSAGVRIVRGDTSKSVSQNFSAVYTGTISGNSVSGDVTFTQNGRSWSGKWSASW